MADPAETGQVADPFAVAALARQALEDKLGQAIATFDLREHTTLTDVVVVVSGSSPPHLKALFESVQVRLKHDGIYCYRKSGTPESGWMVLDYVDCVIHIFAPEIRDYYGVETLWEAAPRLP